MSAGSKNNQNIRNEATAALTGLCFTGSEIASHLPSVLEECQTAEEAVAAFLRQR